MTLSDNRYLDTRGSMSQAMTFSQAIIKGLAPGGGLLVPQQIPQLTLEQIVSLADMPYAQRAAFVYKSFGTDIDDAEIDRLMGIVYADNFDTPDVAPIVKVGNMHVMELWHGPTSAFKDMALQCLPVFFSKAIEVQRQQGQAKEDFLILVATSGDTGKAALEGFKDRDHTKIMVFYPHGGVSDIQYKQMATQLGDNVFVLGGLGDFDDCQTSVKQTFGDAVFCQMLESQMGVKLSSANSINWGRLLPQVVYYVSAYGQMVANGAVKAGDPIDICVPTGNFGNILAAYYAKCMGAPIGKLVCASNVNRVLTDFIQTGVYDIRDRKLILSPSPSMDILVSSNLERQLFELTGRDTTRVRGWMEDLMTKGVFEVDQQTKQRVQELYAAGSATNDESLATIAQVYRQHGYLMDPHTAVAWNVASRMQSQNPMLVVSTAHWAKFGYDVYRALNDLPAGSQLDSEVTSLTGAQLNRKIFEATNAAPVPRGLDVLDDMPLRFTDTCPASKDGVEAAVCSFLAQ